MTEVLARAWREHGPTPDAVVLSPASVPGAPLPPSDRLSTADPLAWRLSPLTFVVSSHGGSQP